MRKKKVFIMAAAMTILMSMTAFAGMGSWQRNECWLVVAGKRRRIPGK